MLKKVLEHSNLKISDDYGKFDKKAVIDIDGTDESSSCPDDPHQQETRDDARGANNLELKDIEMNTINEN